MSPQEPPSPPPILFIIFKRLDTTKMVFEAIRKAKPQKLYIAADGPRTLAEKQATDTVRNYVLKNIDWPCQIFSEFQDQNLGCRYGVSHAITWFFQHEPEGIILEDDCLPHPDFFHFCSELLIHYRDNQKVWGIGGGNFQDGQNRGSGSFYFSEHLHVWGWASWANRWEKYHVELKDIPNFRVLNKRKCSWGEYLYWRKLFAEIKYKKVNTWDYQWMFTMWHHKGLWITPNKNLVGNIGFGPDATHTTGNQNGVPHRAVESIGPIIYPIEIRSDPIADIYTYRTTIEHISIYKRILLRIKKILK